MAKDKKPKLTPVIDLLTEAIKLWSKNLRKFVMIYIWAALLILIPVAVVIFLYALNSASVLGESLIFRGYTIFLMIWAALVAIYFMIRAYLSMFLLIKNNYEGKEWNIYKDSAKYVWSYLALAMLTIVLIFLWFFAFIIPGIVFSVFYMFACYAFIFEGRRDIDAIKRSYELVKGYWWAVFGRVLFLGLVFWAFGLIISVPSFLTPDKSLFSQVWVGVTQAINLLIGPVSLLFTYLIFQDLVKIKK